MWGFHFLLQGIFATQGSNLHPLRWQADSSPQSHLRSPKRTYISIITLSVNRLSAPTKRHRMVKCIQKQNPHLCSLQEIHFRSTDIQSESEGIKKDIHGNGIQKKAGVAMFISEKMNFKIEKVFMNFTSGQPRWHYKISFLRNWYPKISPYLHLLKTICTQVTLSKFPHPLKSHACPPIVARIQTSLPRVDPAALPCILQFSLLYSSCSFSLHVACFLYPLPSALNL